MENILMFAGILIPIILTLVAIIKLPFLKVKAKHPKIFKGVITALTLICVIGATIITQLFILEGELLTIDFTILIASVFAGVFITYNGFYEGFNLKSLVHTFFAKIGDLIKNGSTSKFSKLATKIGFDKASEIITSLTAEQTKKAETDTIIATETK